MTEEKKPDVDPNVRRVITAAVGQILGYNIYRRLGASRWFAFAASSIQVRLAFIEDAIKDQTKTIEVNQAARAINNFYNQMAKQDKPAEHWRPDQDPRPEGARG